MYIKSSGLYVLLLWSCALFAQERNAELGGEGYRTNQYPGVSESASKIFFSNKPFVFSGYFELNQVFPTFKPRDRSSEELELYYSDLYRFSPFFGFRLSKKIMLTAEMQLEYLRDNNLEDEFHVNPELYLDFLFNRKVNVRAGMYPLNIGYINNNEEPILFYSVNRPDVERLIIPTGWNELGVGLYGALTDDLQYFITIGNGLEGSKFRSPTFIRGGATSHFNLKSISVNPQLNYTGLKKTTLSISGYYGGVGQQESYMLNGGESQKVNSAAWMTAGYARFDLKNVRIILMGTYGGLTETEDLYLLTLEKTGNAQVLGSEAYGYYAELGFDVFNAFLSDEKRKRIQQSDQSVFRREHMQIPLFIRYERLNTHHRIARTLPIEEAQVQNESIVTVGANFEPNEKIVLKVDYVFKWELTPGNSRQELFEFGLGFSF